jgi:phage tail sheath protein FI
MAASAAPGVRQEYFPSVSRPGLRTGVPAFLGFAGPASPTAPGVAVELVRWADFGARFGPAPADGYLAAAVRAFFRNGGEACWVVRVAEGADARQDADRLRAALGALRGLEGIDLVCAPDVMRPVVRLLAETRPVTSAERERARDAALLLQSEIVQHCDRTGGRMAILDALPGAGAAELRRFYGPRAEPAEPGVPPPLVSPNAAVYHPWLRADEGGPGWAGLVPPCGHVAGTIARADRREGVHRAPANEPLEGVLDVEQAIGDAVQGELNPRGINCIRAFPGRGIRVWGARTLGAPPWEYVPVRRVFLTLGRWIERALPAAAFEPNGPLLWARIGREVTAYLAAQYRRGALRGATPGDAFFVRCDAGTNPPEVREAGVVVTEIGIAPSVPNEFVIVRFTHGPGGVDLAATA